MKIILAFLCLTSSNPSIAICAENKVVDFGRLASIAKIQPSREKEFRDVIKTFISTKSDITWGVNKDKGNFDLRFVLFDSRLSKQGELLPSAVKDSCFYERTQKSIVCDFNLIRRFAKSIDLDKRPITDNRKQIPIEELLPLRRLSESEMKGTYFHLITWVMGHEIGHLIKKHETSHFLQSDFYSNFGSTSISQTQEMEADQYLSEVMGDPLGKNVSFYLFMLNVMQRFISMKLCPDRSPEHYCDKVHYGQIIFPPKEFLSIGVGGSHPEFLVRLLRLFMVTGQRHQFFPFDYLSKQIYENNIKVRE